MKSKTAFTNKDIYVLLVCIIFLLATLGAVSERGRKRAMEAVCLANLYHWGNIYERYTNENDGDFPGGTHYNPAPGVRGVWFLVFAPYFGDNPNLMLCPCASRPVESLDDSFTFRAWIAHLGGKIYVGSYNENSWTCSREDLAAPSPSRPQDFYWRNVAGVKNKSNIPVLADGRHFDAWPRHYDEPPPYPDSSGIGYMHPPEMWLFCIDRHNGGINMLFMDWSARKVGLKELWTLKWHREFDTEEWLTLAAYDGDIEAYRAVWNEYAPWMSNFKDY